MPICERGTDLLCRSAEYAVATYQIPPTDVPSRLARVQCYESETVMQCPIGVKGSKPVQLSVASSSAPQDPLDAVTTKEPTVYVLLPKIAAYICNS